MGRRGSDAHFLAAQTGQWEGVSASAMEGTTHPKYVPCLIVKMLSTVITYHLLLLKWLEQGLCFKHAPDVNCKVPGCQRKKQGSAFCRVHAGTVDKKRNLLTLLFGSLFGTSERVRLLAFCLSINSFLSFSTSAPNFGITLKRCLDVLYPSFKSTLYNNATQRWQSTITVGAPLPLSFYRPTKEEVRWKAISWREEMGNWLYKAFGALPSREEGEGSTFIN